MEDLWIKRGTLEGRPVNIKGDQKEDLWILKGDQKEDQCIEKGNRTKTCEYKGGPEGRTKDKGDQKEDLWIYSKGGYWKEDLWI